VKPVWQPPSVQWRPRDRDASLHRAAASAVRRLPVPQARKHAHTPAASRPAAGRRRELRPRPFERRVRPF